MLDKKYVATVSYFFSGQCHCQIHSMDWVGLFRWKWVAWLFALVTGFGHVHPSCAVVIKVIPLPQTSRFRLRESDRWTKEEKWECTKCESVFVFNHFRGWHWIWSKKPCDECRKMYFEECDAEHLDPSFTHFNNDNSPPCKTCGATSLQSCDAGLHS